MRTLTWEGIEFGNFISIASIYFWNRSIENFMSSSPLGCDFVASLMTLGSFSKLTRRPRGGGHIQISIQLKGESCQGPSEFTWPLVFLNRNLLVDRRLSVAASVCLSSLISNRTWSRRRGAEAIEINEPGSYLNGNLLFDRRILLTASSCLRLLLTHSPTSPKSKVKIWIGNTLHNQKF